MMAGRKKARKRSRKRLEEQASQREPFNGYDNWDIVDIDERKPSDYWAIREAREEYCKEYYGTENC
jgi:hypothetical protein